MSGRNLYRDIPVIFSTAGTRLGGTSNHFPIDCAVSGSWPFVDEISRANSACVISLQICLIFIDSRVSHRLSFVKIKYSLGLFPCFLVS